MNCRRCTECEGRSHHWLEDPEAFDDQWRELPGEYACKHCDQRGEECPECGGDGGQWLDDDGADVALNCPCCKGEGVIPVGFFA